MASRSPTALSSNLGQRIPGVSKSSRFLLMCIHCFPLVTPGLLPVFVQAFPANALINVDLPTLGIPTIIARTGLFNIPFALFRSILSLHASLISCGTCLTPNPFLALILRQ